MNNRLAYFINTRLQPGVAGSAKSEPFQRLVCGGKPLKRFFVFPGNHTGLKSGVNEKTHSKTMILATVYAV